MFRSSVIDACSQAVTDWVELVPGRDYDPTKECSITGDELGGGPAAGLPAVVHINPTLPY